MADARSRLELVSDLSQAELLNLGQVGPSWSKTNQIIVSTSVGYFHLALTLLSITIHHPSTSLRHV